MGPVPFGKYDRSVLALELEPLSAAEAKRRMSDGGNSSKVGRQISDNPQRTDEQLAKLAGTSRGTIRTAHANALPLTAVAGTFTEKHPAASRNPQSVTKYGTNTAQKQKVRGD